MKKVMYLMCLILVIGCETAENSLEGDGVENGNNEENNIVESTQGLIESVELDNGLKIKFYELGDDMGIAIDAETGNLEQMASLDEARQILNEGTPLGMASVEIYEALTHEKAPELLAAAEERLFDRVEQRNLVADEVALNDLDALASVEESELADLPTDVLENEMTPLMSASDFIDQHCGEYDCNCHQIKQSGCLTNYLWAKYSKNYVNASLAVVNAVDGGSSGYFFFYLGKEGDDWWGTTAWEGNTYLRTRYGDRSWRERMIYVNVIPWLNEYWGGRNWHGYLAQYKEVCTGDAPFCYFEL